MHLSCKSCSRHSQRFHVSISQAFSCLSIHTSGMSLRVMCTALALLVLILHHTEARPSQRGGPMMDLTEQDPGEILYESEQRGSREIATLMYQMLQHAAEQQQQQQQQHQDEAEQDSNPIPPEEFPIVTEPVASAADKRGSYMSLCHFKICNMGRKRNLRKTQWNRY